MICPIMSYRSAIPPFVVYCKDEDCYWYPICKAKREAALKSLKGGIGNR